MYIYIYIYISGNTVLNNSFITKLNISKHPVHKFRLQYTNPRFSM